MIMKRGGWASKVPTGAIPGLGNKRKSGLDKVIGVLPTGGKKGIGVGRKAGTAGGVLAGVGAAVAASQVIGRRGDRDHNGQNAESADTGGSDSERGESANGQSDAKNASKNNDENAKKEDKKDGKSGGGNGAEKVKVTNIVEQIDIGAPRRVVYDQWTRFQDFPSFMKKVISVDQESEEKLHGKAKVMWSSRAWDSVILEQVPDKHIIWRSKGPKGYVDGAVSFHRIAPNMTRVLVVLEYHPQGIVEKTGNLWRAPGRRARLELKHFRRFVMTQTLLHRDELEGWRGEIRDSEVVKSHEDAVAEEEKDREETQEDQTADAR
jgi:uncharacterized membrane protein